VEISEKRGMNSLLYYTDVHMWLNLSGRHRKVKGWCGMTDLRQWLLTGRLQTGDKLPLLLL
jgi:hypothetical protein